MGFNFINFKGFDFIRSGEMKLVRNNYGQIGNDYGEVVNVSKYVKFPKSIKAYNGVMLGGGLLIAGIGLIVHQVFHIGAHAMSDAHFEALNQLGLLEKIEEWFHSNIAE